MYMYIRIYICIYVCVCVRERNCVCECVCVCINTSEIHQRYLRGMHIRIMYIADIHYLCVQEVFIYSSIRYACTRCAYAVCAG